MKHKTPKQSKPNIVRTCHYNCGQCKTNGRTNNLPCY